MMVRVVASCSLHNLSLRGPGIASTEYWGYSYPGLVTIGMPGAPRITVDLQSVKIKRVGHSNGIKVHGPGDVCMARCHISNCRRNGLIVQVSSPLAMQLCACLGQPVCCSCLPTAARPLGSMQCSPGSLLVLLLMAVAATSHAAKRSRKCACASADGCGSQKTSSQGLRGLLGSALSSRAGSVSDLLAPGAT